MCSTSNTDLRPRLTATVNGGGGVGGCRTEMREEGRGGGGVGGGVGRGEGGWTGRGPPEIQTNGRHEGSCDRNHPCCRPADA